VTPGRPSPVERVRARIARGAGPEVAAAVPRGFQRLGTVVVVELPEALRAHFPEIGAAYAAELGVRTVLRRRGAVTGDFRLPRVERIAGNGTETEVREHGIRYGFDAERIMFARGNKSERQRAGRLVRPGETVVDLFAGIGYFALPALVHGRAARVHACEANPVAMGYLVSNAVRNGVVDRLTAYPGDNREAPIPPAVADRVFLGLLPDSLPWVPRALGLLAAGGGWIHVHRLQGSRDGASEATDPVAEVVARCGGSVEEATVQPVKAYGPGRRHVVVDLRVRPLGPYHDPAS